MREFVDGTNKDLPDRKPLEDFIRKKAELDENADLVKFADDYLTKRLTPKPKQTKVESKKAELKETKPDVMTLSGMGEPTLAKNIGEAIEVIRELTDLPIAILTNSSLMYQKEVRNALLKLDIIYDDPQFNYEEKYSQIYYWNSTIS